ncbi:MAG: hypothetical protein IKB29_00965 [Clostridia bacterium]|nr:hypothetical protein [Clostridia bacterium]
MYICQKCNYSSESPANFCPLCGNPMVTHQPTYTNGSNSISNRVKKFVGMGLSIYGFIFAAIAAFYDLIICFTASVAEESEIAIAAIMFTVIFGIFGMPCSIIGLVFSNQARNLGDTSTFSRVGKAFGLAGIITFAASFFLSILTTAAGM